MSNFETAAERIGEYWETTFDATVARVWDARTEFVHRSPDEPIEEAMATFREWLEYEETVLKGIDHPDVGWVMKRVAGSLQDLRSGSRKRALRLTLEIDKRFGVYEV